MAKKSEETGARKPKKAAPKAESAPKPRKSSARSEEPAPEIKPARAKAKPAAAETKAKSAPTTAKSAAAKPRAVKPKAARKTGKLEVTAIHVGEPIEDPIGDTTDGEARIYLSEAIESESHPEMAAYRADTADDAVEGTLENRAKSAGSAAVPQEFPPSGTAHSSSSAESDSDEAPAGKAGFAPGPGPAAKLDRLQKILSQAGIASRRHAEEMIEAGRVAVNGQVVTQLGAKADAARDHIRVDGKLISGAERHRYFALNKPKGFVTTVSDPEGRPTVMQFFSKMKERLYPVGRLDYDSEGLLLVTNDGELANQLTRAASGIEKTYLVKVAGQPTEDELDKLRSGVAIEREGPGSDRVHTAPAQIRPMRHGDNPWYEVVLTEGRNRELRKMFQSIGHFVEKIRRVGYGPLVLDLEPGKLRELAPEEVSTLRLAAEGKWKPRRPKAGKMPSRDAGQPAERGRFKKENQRGGETPREGGARDFGPRGAENPRQPGARAFGQRGGESPRERGARDFSQREPREFGRRDGGQFAQRPSQGPPRDGKPFGDRPAWKQRDERPGARPGARPGPRPGPRPGEQRSFRGKPGFGSGAGPRPEGRLPGFRPQSQRREPASDNRPRPGWDKPRPKTFGEGRRTDFDGRPPRKPNQPRGEGWTREPGRSEAGRSSPDRSGPGQKWSRGEGSGRGDAASARPFRGTFKSAPGRPAPGDRRPPDGRSRPAAGSNDRGAASGPRGFAPGGFSKPGGSRFGFKGKPGRNNRGGPPPGGRKRG
jgi:23S rRNA pseudouridine2605 synthase